MAFSWNWPQLARPIKDDVPAISAMFNAAVRWNPEYGGGTDLASGMKRLVAVTNGYQLQNFSGSAWASLGKLMHDVDKLDGYHASTTAVKNTIPVYNANALLPGGITGNAATATKLKTARALQVGGIASGTSVNFDGSGPVTLTVDRITVNNEADDAVNGVLTTAHGGTGRTDGAAQDVRVASLSGEVNASDYGQVGRAKSLGSTHLDTVIVDGFYVGGTNTAYHSEEYGYPQTGSGATFLRVISTDRYILQILETNAELWRRTSTTSGASWNGWLPSGGTHDSTIALYVSKSGSDSNSGLSAEYPVLTIDRAIRIAMGMSLSKASGYVVLYVGEGNWGDVIFRNLPFNIHIRTYDGSTPTAFSESLPVFRQIYALGSYIEVYGVVADALLAAYGGVLKLGAGYKRIGALRARERGSIVVDSQNAATNVIEVHSQSVYTDHIISAYNGGFIWMQYIHIRLVENITAGNFMYCANSGLIEACLGRTVFDSSTYTFTGKKAYIVRGGFFNSLENNGATSCLTTVLPGTAPEIQNGAIVNGYTIGQVAQADFEELKADVVHKTGDEVVEGKKTFTATPKVQNAKPSIVFENTAIIKGTAPSSDQSFVLEFTDKAGTGIANRLGAIANMLLSENTVKSELRAYAPVSGSNMTSIIAAVYPASGTPYGTAPSTPANSTGTQIVTADYLLSANSGVVHNTGTETVAGAKTFTSNVMVKNAAPAYHLVQTDITLGADAASGKAAYSYINFMDSTGSTYIGRLGNQLAASGNTQTYLSASKYDGSANATIGVVYPASGVPYGIVPTPADTSNSNHIATTKWVRERSKWVYKNASLTTDATLGKRVLDLTNYLPNDNEEYEVLVRMRIERTDSSGTNTVGTLYLASDTKFMLLQADGANWQQQSESSIVPVPSTHQLSYEVGGYSPGTFEIFAYGYRKA